MVFRTSHAQTLSPEDLLSPVDISHDVYGFNGEYMMDQCFDSDDPYSSPMNPGPPFPGEDYVMNAPAGLSFPTNISGGTAVISVEPYPDNGDEPFALKPLVGDIPQNATDHFNYPMMLNPGSFPTGTASK